MSEGKRERIDYVDFLKAIALTGIFIAHTGPPGWMMMLRCFDVPLMVFLSGMLGLRSYERRAARQGGTGRYYLSRFKRLVFPVWIFLVLYFTLDYLLRGSLREGMYYVWSFLLTRYRMDYVWIILIYLYCALLTPLFSRIRPDLKGWALVGAAYLAYEAACYFRLGTEVRLIDATLLYLIPYGAAAWLGARYRDMSGKMRMCVLAASTFVFIALAVYYRFRMGVFYAADNAKYPPRAYFLSYGVMCAFALTLFCEKVSLRVYASRPVRFVSSHSMWLYLWQILWLRVYDEVRLPQIWYMKFAAVAVFSCLTVAAVNKALDALEKKASLPVIRYLRN